MDSGVATPVLVKGVERNWSVPLSHAKHTAVGAIKNSTASCNGVIFEINPQDMNKLDVRERGYQKIEIFRDQITSDVKFNGTVWTYVGNEIGQPCVNYPIPMSYLDVIMNGCLSHGESFLESFFETTGNWQNLLDDRSNPRYPRFIDSKDHHQKHNELLEKHLPKFYQDRR